MTTATQRKRGRVLAERVGLLLRTEHRVELRTSEARLLDAAMRDLTKGPAPTDAEVSDLVLHAPVGELSMEMALRFPHLTSAIVQLAHAARPS